MRADIGVFVNAGPCGQRPCHRAVSGPIKRLWQGPFLGADHDRHMGKMGNATNMINVAMGDDHQRDIGRPQPQQRKLGTNQMLWAETH